MIIFQPGTAVICTSVTTPVRRTFSRARGVFIFVRNFSRGIFLRESLSKVAADLDQICCYFNALDSDSPRKIPRARAREHGSSNVRDIKKIFFILIDLLIISKISISLISITRARGAHARWSLQLGTTAVGSVTLPPLVLASLPLALDQRTKSPTEEHHTMPCWPCRAAAAGIQLVARLGRSSCVSPQLQL